MRKLLFISCALVLLSVSSCKKVCYQCSQYCAYCVNKNDSTIAYKVCATSAQGNNEINSVLAAYEDSGYVCNLLNQQTSFCGDNNSNNKAITYYEEENYYCIQQ